MKKNFIAFTLFTVAAVSVLSAKTKLTIKNTVGADSDELGEFDLFSYTNTTDISGATQSRFGFSLGDEFQIDLENDLFDARFRLDSFYQNNSDEIPSFVIAPSGYFHFTPIPQFGIIAGTNFYKHFAIQSAYLAAADDTTKYGRLLTDSLGEEKYLGNEYISLFINGFAGGLTSDWTFGNGYLKLAAGGTFYVGENVFEKAIDFGINGGIANLFDVGFTAHNITDDDRKFGAFLGYTGSENIIANLGFYYNFTTGDYLPEERVTGSDDDDNDVYKYKKQSTKYALGLSGGYNFDQIGLGIYGDVISGLTNEYIGTIKHYDTEGNLVSTETGTIVRGSTIVKYYYNKAGTKAKTRNDKCTHEGIPFYAGLRVTYQFSPIVEGVFKFSVNTLMNASDTTWLTFYPSVKIRIPNGGTIGTGIRLEMNQARYNGISSVSVPLTYTWKFKKKF